VGDAEVHGPEVHGPDVQGPDVRGIDEAVAAVADLDDVPVVEHVARFDAVHRALAEALSTIDGA
jgi:hypothetical protein